MANVFDVAAYILERKGHMSTMKLQKLVYYSQAWSLVWDGKVLFPETIEAWRDGPVTKDLFAIHKGVFSLDRLSKGQSNLLTEAERETVDAVLDAYGGLDGATLSRMSHDELPWKLAREGIPEGDHCSVEITPDSMKSYYSSL